MSVAEVAQAFQDIQSNWLAGSLVVFYYLLIYWPRLKEGFGIGKRVNLDRLEKQYKILQLKIEIEEQKQKSSIDKERLQELERETWLELEALDKTGKDKKLAFTQGQKFAAIPLIILTVILSISEILQSTPEETTYVVIGAIFVILLIIIAFWGMPKLVHAKPSIGRTTGFIIFWWFTFYILIYFSGFFLDAVLFAYTNPEVELFSSDDAASFYFGLALIISFILGLMNKLPRMNQNEQPS